MSPEEDSKELEGKQVSLKIVFLAIYTLGLIGSLGNVWKDAGLNKNWNPNFTTGDQFVSFIKQIFSLAGFIDGFLFPSLASAITITAGVKAYRHYKKKLKKKGNRFLLAGAVIFALIIVWMLLSLLLFFFTT